MPARAPPWLFRAALTDCLTSRLSCSRSYRGLFDASSRLLNRRPLCPPNHGRRGLYSTPRQRSADEAQDVMGVLEERGLINQLVGNRDELSKLLRSRDGAVYVGIDPTASSLHVGHLIPLMALYWIYIYGCKVICLTGGATAMVGDPSGRTSARDGMAAATRESNRVNISQQLQDLLRNVDASAIRVGFPHAETGSSAVLDNLEWFEKTSALELLSKLAVGMPISPMLGRDSVQIRLKSHSTMSLAEFLYPMMQTWDWWHLYSKHNVRVQIGGSDQFGNILAGADGVQHMRKHHGRTKESSGHNTSKSQAPQPTPPFGLTVPLLTTSSGQKFGKSAGNAIWLDAGLTSPFDLYKYFVSTPDSEVSRYLKYFTFLPMPEIASITARHAEKPEKRLAQHTLATEVTSLIHGRSIGLATAKDHQTLFASAANTASSTAPVGALSGSAVAIPRSLLANTTMGKLLYHVGLATSASEGRTLVKNGGVYIGQYEDGQMEFVPFGNEADGTRAPKSRVSWEEVIDGRDKVIIRKGKSSVVIVEVLDDEIYPQGPHDFQGSDAWWENTCPENLRHLRYTEI